TVAGLASLTGPLLDSVAVGATLATVTVKVVVAVSPPVSVAVMVTVIGPVGPSARGWDQFQAPVALSWVTVRGSADSVTVPRPSASSKASVLVAGPPSLTVTAAWSLAIVGGWLMLVRVNWTEADASAVAADTL